MKRSKHLAFDMNLLKYMNKKFKNYKRDVGADSIFRPNAVELSTGFNPQVWVKNYGVVSATFWTRCEIEANGGNVYRDSVLVSNLYPNLTLPLSFSLATLNPGIYQFKVRTLYNGDIVPSNDEKTKEFTKIYEQEI